MFKEVPSCCELNLTKEEEMDFIKMSNALGNPIRFEIIKYLLTHPGCITGDLVKILPIAQSTVSQHLKVLKEAQIIQGIVEGTATNYCINRESLDWYKQKAQENL